MLITARERAARSAATSRLKSWTRVRFNLDDDWTVMAAELACGLPGCPPRETVVVFWRGEDRRYRFKIFKPIAEVVPDDLPFAWLLPALADDDGIGLQCC